MECTKLAKLPEAPVKEIRALEERLGVTLIAYEKVHLYKELNPAQIEKIQVVEKDLGVILVAYEA